MHPNTTPTPMTDAAEVENANFVKVVNANLSRYLERELTEKTNEVAKLRKYVEKLEIYSPENVAKIRKKADEMKERYMKSRPNKTLVDVLAGLEEEDVGPKACLICQL